MRLLQVLQKNQRRGAETFARQLGTELRRLGHTCSTVYLEPHRGSGILDLQEHEQLLSPSPSGALDRLLSPTRLRALSRLVGELEPDVVQVAGGHTVKLGAAMARISPRRGWRLVGRNIGTVSDWLRGTLKRRLYRSLVMSGFDGFVSVTEQTRQDFLALYRPDFPVERIATGIDPGTLVPHLSRDAVRQARATPIECFVCLFLGSLSREKRPDRFLRIANQLREVDNRICFWIAGDGPERTRSEQLCRELELSEAVRFLGAESDLGSLFGAVDALLMTSDTEGIPRVLIEAGLSGVPVVAPQIGGIDEFVKDQETGFLFEVDDERSAAQAVARLHEHRELGRKLACQAKAWLTDRYTISAIAERYLAFYESLGVSR